MTFSLIYPAIFVFLMMSIGVIMTVVEFNRSQKTEKEVEQEEKEEMKKRFRE